jgi:hypothetical protein
VQAKASAPPIEFTYGTINIPSSPLVIQACVFEYGLKNHQMRSLPQWYKTADENHHQGWHSP